MSKQESSEVKALLDQGMMPREVSLQLCIPYYDVRKVHRRYNKQQHRHDQDYKEHIRDLLEGILSNGAERLLREIPNMPVHMLPVMLGIIFDKLQLIRGEATQHIDTTHSNLTREKLIDVLENMKRDRKREEREERTRDVEATVEQIPVPDKKQPKPRSDPYAEMLGRLESEAAQKDAAREAFVDNARRRYERQYPVVRPWAGADP